MDIACDGIVVVDGVDECNDIAFGGCGFIDAGSMFSSITILGRNGNNQNKP